LIEKSEDIKVLPPTVLSESTTIYPFKSNLKNEENKLYKTIPSKKNNFLLEVFENFEVS